MLRMPITSHVPYARVYVTLLLAELKDVCSIHLDNDYRNVRYAHAFMVSFLLVS